MQQENERSLMCKGFVANWTRRQDLSISQESPSLLLASKAQGSEPFPG